MKYLFWLLTAAILVAGLFVGAALWMARTDNQPALPVTQSDPTALGASLRADPAPEAAPTVAMPEETATQPAATPVPRPLFWMAMGALCAATGILVATRERKPARRRMFT